MAVKKIIFDVEYRFLKVIYLAKPGNELGAMYYICLVRL